MTNNNSLARDISDLVDRSVSKVQKAIDQLDADDIINLKISLDEDDVEAAVAILDQVRQGPVEKLDARDSLKEINRRGRKALDSGDPLDSVWDIIGNLSKSDWKMIWPAVKQNILSSLYFEVSDEETDSVDKSQAEEIFDYAKDLLAESVVYNGQLVEVFAAKGPNGTVGILVDGQRIMVDRRLTQRVDESVLGMTAMPSLTRIQQLAGIGSEFDQEYVAMPDLSRELAVLTHCVNSIGYHLQISGRKDAAMDAAHQACEILDTIKQVLGRE
jgi:hypothetical protein